MKITSLSSENLIFIYIIPLTMYIYIIMYIFIYVILLRKKIIKTNCLLFTKLITKYCY